MIGPLLRTGTLTDYHPVGAVGHPVYLAAAQLRAALARRLGAEVADCFAIPQRNEEGDTLDWYARRPGLVVPWSAASLEERASVTEQLRAHRERIDALAKTMQADPNPERQVFGRLLDHVLSFPDEEHLYLVDGRPVISFWGFVRDRESVGSDPLVNLGRFAAPVPADDLRLDLGPVDQPGARRGWPWWALLFVPLFLAALLAALALFSPLRGCVPLWSPDLSDPTLDALDQRSTDRPLTGDPKPMAVGEAVAVGGLDESRLEGSARDWVREDDGTAIDRRVWVDGVDRHATTVIDSREVREDRVDRAHTSSTTVASESDIDRDTSRATDTRGADEVERRASAILDSDRETSAVATDGVVDAAGAQGTEVDASVEAILEPDALPMAGPDTGSEDARSEAILDAEGTGADASAEATLEPDAVPMEAPGAESETAPFDAIGDADGAGVDGSPDATLEPEADSEETVAADAAVGVDLGLAEEVAPTRDAGADGGALPDPEGAVATPLDRPDGAERGAGRADREPFSTAGVDGAAVASQATAGPGGAVDPAGGSASAEATRASAPIGPRADWQTATTLQDPTTGLPIQMEYRARDGAGRLRLRRHDGSICEAGARLSREGGRLVTQTEEDIRCPDGTSFGRPRVECEPAVGGTARCVGRNPDGSTFAFDLTETESGATAP
jgi:hypothetical protein